MRITQAFAGVLALALVAVTLPAQSTGAVAGQALWTDRVPSSGIRVSAIAVTTPPQAALRTSGSHNKDWVVGDSVTASTVTDSAGRFRIEGLPPGRYHIVPGPTWVPGPASAIVKRPQESTPRSFSDVATIDSSHYVTVAAGAVVENVNFEILRNPDRIAYVPDRMLTITGTISMKTFGTAGGGLLVLVPNSDGSTTEWNMRGGYGPGNQRFWWPGYQPNLPYSASPIAEMVNAGETVTISGIEVETWDTTRPGTEYSRGITVFEITRGGR